MRKNKINKQEETPKSNTEKLNQAVDTINAARSIVILGKAAFKGLLKVAKIFI